MADAPIAFDALEAFEVHADLPPQIAFNHVLAILDGMHDLGKLLLGQILRADGGIDFGLGQNISGVGGSNAIDGAQRNIDALVGRNFYSDNTCHNSGCLALPLFVPGVSADHPDNAFAPDNLAILAKLLN